MFHPFSWCAFPNCLWTEGGTQSTWRKPTRAQAEHANSKQKGFSRSWGLKPEYYASLSCDPTRLPACLHCGGHMEKNCQQRTVKKIDFGLNHKDAQFKICGNRVVAVLPIFLKWQHRYGATSIIYHWITDKCLRLGTRVISGPKYK